MRSCIGAGAGKRHCTAAPARIGAAGSHALCSQIRNYFLDQFFPACSFFAEEEFYLIALPFLVRCDTPCVVAGVLLVLICVTACGRSCGT